MKYELELRKLEMEERQKGREFEERQKDKELEFRNKELEHKASLAASQSTLDVRETHLVCTTVPREGDGHLFFAFRKNCAKFEMAKRKFGNTVTECFNW